jgi:predicted metal-dependent phosphoesterase TrpH
MYQSLHNHSTVSDGKLSYLEILDEAEQVGINVIAFTDHDSLPSKKIVKELKNTKHSVDWIIGVEISSGLPLELGGVPFNNFHVVGLFIDPFNQNLIDYCKLAQNARVERTEKFVKNLKGIGFDIEVKDIYSEATGEAIGRPHIVKALLSKEKNIQIIRELKQKMVKDAENDFVLMEKYKKMISGEESKYPYHLFLTEDAYIKDIYVDYLYSVDMDKSVKLIRDAGGFAFLAHWGLVKNKVGEDIVEKLLKEKRLDGIETVFWFEGINEFKDETLGCMDKAEELVDKYNAFKSGGIDAHIKEHFSGFIKDKWVAERSIGLAQKIIKQAKPNLEWSSFNFN